MKRILALAFWALWAREAPSDLERRTAISHPGARRRVKSLWERDFCVKCDEAHFGARVLGPLGTRVPDSRASPDHFWDGDRKSTRLNSSHLGISYAVFCLKTKTCAARGHGRRGRPAARAGLVTAPRRG